MTVLPLDEIIDEIDAYLSHLHQARELLLDRRTEAPQKRAPRRKRVTPRQADPASSSGFEMTHLHRLLIQTAQFGAKHVDPRGLVSGADVEADTGLPVGHDTSDRAP